MTWEPIDVATDQPYQVLIDSGVAKLLPQFLGGVDRVAVIHPPSLADKLAKITAGLDQQVTVIPVPEGESGKTASTHRGAGRRWRRPASPARTRSLGWAGERPPTWPASSRPLGCGV